MIAFGLRLTLRGGRESAARIAFISAGVAVGVVMILFAIAANNGLHAQDARYGWLTTTAHNRAPSVNETTSDALWWRWTRDEFHGRTIERVDVAATGARSPIPPGISRLPSPGDFYASPALARLLTTVPTDQLAARFPGRQIGTIGDVALTSPSSLIVVVGHSPTDLAGRPGALSVRSIETAARQHSYSTFQQVALGVGALGLLFPVLIFVGMATRIAASRREQRLAAMRLVGATPRQVAILAAAEAATAAVIAVLLGIGLFFLVRPVLVQIPLTGDAWFDADLTVGPLACVLLCITIPAGAALAAAAALRRVATSPLGVTRRVAPPSPNAKRLIPLGVGTGILALFALAGHPYDRNASSTYAPTILIGFALVIAGIVAAGPWLTMAATRLLFGHVRRPASLLASRRLLDDPTAAFRAVSGLILAVFVGSVFVAGASTAISSGGLEAPLAYANSTAIARPTNANGSLTTGTADRVAEQLRSQAGLTGVTLVHLDSANQVNGYPTVVVSCHDILRTPAIGRCHPVAQFAAMPIYSLDVGHTEPQTVWPTASVASARIATMRIAAIIIATDGTTAALERVRTTVETTAPDTITVPKTLGQVSAATRRDVSQFQHMADIAVLISLLIAGCSLAVAIAGGLIERRRPFGLLRLSGMPLGVLRGVVLLEAAVPLIGLAIVAAGGGLLTATLLLRALRGTTVRLPGAEYYLMLFAGLIAALSIVSITLPLLRRISSPENLRTE